MSPSEVGAPSAEELSPQIRRTLTLVDRAIADGTAASVDPAVLDDLVTAAIRLFYVTAGERPDLGPNPESVSPSEALTLVAALLTAHDVSTFDLALWLSRTRGR